MAEHTAGNFELDAELRAALAGTIYAGKIRFSLVTDSTNTDCAEAARLGAPHGTVYFADEQLAGRGRGEHAWRSAAGEGLYVSVLLRQGLPSTRLHILPLSAGLAAADAIRSVSGLSIDLRWPNDLLIAGRKAGGILVEARTEALGAGSVIAFAVVGIGINVHQRSFAPGLSTPATSLDLEAGRRIRRKPLLVSLLKSLERETLGLLDPAAGKAIPQRMEQASTWVRGRHVQVHGPQACTGNTDGLNEHGFLLVRTDNGLVTVQTGGIRAAEIS